MPELLKASRPFSWINTGLPFLAAAIVAVPRTTQAVAAVAIGLFYFLGPYNLAMYGLNDLYDYESDRLNPRKGGSVEGAVLAPGVRRKVWLAVAVTNVPLVAILAVLAGPLAGALVGVALFSTVTYSVPPFRTKTLPVLDSINSSLHFVLPCTCGWLVAGGAIATLPWPALAAFFAWGLGSQALGAIQDVEYDRSAGIGSIAVTLGARRTAAAATTAYLVAVALTASIPGGIVAAAALVPYVLLAASCLSSDQRQARRAWRGFLGMNLVVGFVITQVLLHAWGVGNLSTASLMAWGSAAGVGACIGILLLNEKSLTRRAPKASRLNGITVVVPARNEAGRIAACLEALLLQRYPGAFRVVVIDDGSTDATWAEATRVLGDVGRVISAGDRPSGWTGKCWACHLGARDATTPLIAFVDCDTVLGPDALASAAAEVAAQRGGMVSLLTSYDVRGAMERALIPAFAFVQLCFMPIAVVNWSKGRPRQVAFGYGPCMVMVRADYEKAGGHAAIASSDREDADLGRLFAGSGLPVRTVRGADLGATRHFRSAVEVAACWRRTYYAYTGHSLAVAIAGMAGIVAVTLLPPAMVAVAWVTGDRLALAGAVIGTVGLLSLRLLLAVAERQPLTTVLWHPVTFAATFAFQAASIADGLAGRQPVWRGRALSGDAA
jgi:4-hydroxybenzoate polyprenyltransferase/GT2 family glycosyltransferase